MELLTKGMAELGLAWDEGQLEQFRVLFRELIAGNERANLTAITSREEVQVKHYLDSLTLVTAVGTEGIGGMKVLDLGSGAGFPGLAVKIMFPSVELTLADSVRKKTRFMEAAVGVMGLSGVTVLTGRAEELAHDAGLREKFDLVLARGVAKLPTLLEYCLPFCRTGGRVVAWKHGGNDEELTAGARVSPVLGGGVPAVYRVPVTGLTDDRILVAVEKAAQTPREFPRRTGVPAKSPLSGPVTRAG